MELTCAAAPLPDLDVELLAIILDEDGSLTGPAGELDEHLSGALSRAIERKHIRPGKTGTTLVSGAATGPHHVLLVSAKANDDEPGEAMRGAGGTIASKAHALKAERVAVLAAPGAGADEAAAVVEGLVLGAYRYEPYKSSGDDDDDTQPQVDVAAQVRLLSGDAEVVAAVRHAKVLADATNWARDLANTPGNDMTPAKLAQVAGELAGAHEHLKLRILDEAELDKLGMGLIAAVGRGSANPPRMLVLEWDPPADSRADADRLCFVGKAVTFDTGGISIKPAAGMADMRLDKSGGCAVIGAMRAIAELGVQQRVLAIVGAAENMPGSRAYKPGDVFAGYDGTSVEITNTDAEGRLVLADAISYARELGCGRIVELSTLTGMTAIFLGTEFAGCYAAEGDEFTSAALDAARATGDRAWLMPQDDSYKPALKSEIADLANSGPRAGGGIYAGLFLRHFAKDTPFVHMDIAGSGMLDKPRRYFHCKGASGWGVRLLTHMASNS